MKRTIRLLTALLVAQFALAIGIGFTGQGLSQKGKDKPLVAVDAGKVDRLVIEGPNNARVILVKKDGSWKLPETGDFPADSARVDGLLRQLAPLKSGQPVATTRDALTRFKVSDKTFERRITLGSDGKNLAVLYFGTSPSMRLTHARPADRNEVYAVEFASFEAPATSAGWEDKDILKTPADKIASIQTEGLVLERTVHQAAAPADTDAGKADDAKGQGGAGVQAGTGKPMAAKPAEPVWKAEGLGDGERLDTGAAARLADLVANLRIGSVLGQEGKPEYGLSSPVLTLALVRNDGRKLDYSLGKMASGTDYVLKTSGRAEYFRLPEYAAKPLIEAAVKETLLGIKPVGDKPKADMTPKPQ